jgi:hypothetical protein
MALAEDSATIAPELMILEDASIADRTFDLCGHFRARDPICDSAWRLQCGTKDQVLEAEFVPLNFPVARPYKRHQDRMALAWKMWAQFELVSYQAAMVLHTCRGAHACS